MDLFLLIMLSEVIPELEDSYLSLILGIYFFPFLFSFLKFVVVSKFNTVFLKLKGFPYFYLSVIHFG